MKQGFPLNVKSSQLKSWKGDRVGVGDLLEIE